jgi:hypothetical protein
MKVENGWMLQEMRVETSDATPQNNVLGRTYLHLIADRLSGRTCLIGMVCALGLETKNAAHLAMCHVG